MKFAISASKYIPGLVWYLANDNNSHVNESWRDFNYDLGWMPD